jgi:hypothetical protein
MTLLAVGPLALVPLVLRFTPLGLIRELPEPQEPAMTESLAEETTF